MDGVPDGYPQPGAKFSPGVDDSGVSKETTCFLFWIILVVANVSLYWDR